MGENVVNRYHRITMQIFIEAKCDIRMENDVIWHVQARIQVSKFDEFPEGIIYKYFLCTPYLGYVFIILQSGVIIIILGFSVTFWRLLRSHKVRVKKLHDFFGVLSVTNLYDTSSATGLLIANSQT